MLSTLNLMYFLVVSFNKDILYSLYKKLLLVIVPKVILELLTLREYRYSPSHMQFVSLGHVLSEIEIRVILISSICADCNLYNFIFSLI